MGALVYTQTPFTASKEPAVSVGGGIRAHEVYATATFGATYATGGQTFTQPTVPTNYDLWAVEVLAHDAGAGIDIRWDLSTATPKLLAYDEDDTSGIAAQLANSSAALAAVVVKLRLVYVAGL